MAAVSDNLSQVFEDLSTWGRWGTDDQRGSLNFITPDNVRHAASLVVSGKSISLGRDLETVSSPETPSPARHEMLATGADRHGSGIAGYEASRDRIGTDMHGTNLSHVDALSHMFVDGKMYNGVDASLVTEEGAEANSIMTMADGVVTRGVLLDVPGARGVEYLEPEDAITPDDLDDACEFGGVSVGAGDAVIISTGRDALRRARGEGFSGLHSGMAGLDPSCLAWLADRSVAVLGSDGISDRMPPRNDPRWPFPIHQIAIVAMGVPLLDALKLDELLAVARGEHRFDFLFMLSVLRIPKGTASPANPLAVF